MFIGNKIKELRRYRGITQAELAQALGVTSQAVSKWEGNNSSPDIDLLPAIAAYFGISIDDMFSYSREKEYEKIEKMVEFQQPLSNTEFAEEERFLLTELEKDPDLHRANALLANWYLNYAGQLRRKASRCAKTALKLEPNCKDDMTLITHAEQGALYDWDVKNHHELIDYWYEVVHANDRNPRAYLYLLDNLIADGRLAEASEVRKEAAVKAPDPIYESYEIEIKMAKDGFEAQKARFVKMAEDHPDDWRILFNVANQFSQHEAYREAIEYWRRAFEAKEKPRYTNFHAAIAQCCLRLGEPEGAIEALKQQKKLLAEDWGVTFGGEVEDLDRRIRELSEKNRS